MVVPAITSTFIFFLSINFNPMIHEYKSQSELNSNGWYIFNSWLLFSYAIWQCYYYLKKNCFLVNYDFLCNFIIFYSYIIFKIYFLCCLELTPREVKGKHLEIWFCTFKHWLQQLIICLQNLFIWLLNIK